MCNVSVHAVLLSHYVLLSQTLSVEQVAKAFSVFATSADEFFAEFDFIRPSKEGSELPSLILTADDTSDTFEGNGVDLGVKASMVLHELGYRCIGVYPDGLSDWRMNGGQPLKGYDDEKKEMDFYEIRRGRADSSMVIIDVRTKAERQQNGAIKQTLHIPCKLALYSFVVTVVDKQAFFLPF